MVSPQLPETFTARLVSARPLTPRVRELVFERADGAPCRYAAGQWMSLVLPVADPKAPSKLLRRAYSIASLADGSPRFELVVTKVEQGAASAWLHEAQPGATLEVKGPQGFFTRPPETARSSLLVATGTGVAPFRGMILDAVRAGRSEPMWLLFGVRAPDEALYHEELTRLAREHPWLRVELTLSRPPPGWAGRTGYVQGQVRELWAALAARGGEPEAYICGVKKMLEAVRVVLRVELGLERKRVHLEAYD